MKQLLEYGIKLGRQAQSGNIDPEYLAKEAEVSRSMRRSALHSLHVAQRLVQELKALES